MRRQICKSGQDAGSDSYSHTAGIGDFCRSKPLLCPEPHQLRHEMNGNS